MTRAAMLALKLLAFSSVAPPGVARAQAAPVQAPLCTDRPTKSNNACTVPAGHVQIEAEAANWSRLDDGRTRVDVLAYAAPTLKLGLDASTDVQLALTPYLEARTRTAAGVDRIGGFGDTVLRMKRRLTDPDARLQVAAIPFVKAPTARRGLGNRAWEGGVSLPIQYALPGGFGLTVMPELDLLRDADGRGDHAQFVGTLNLGRALSPTLGVAAELWTAQNFDPAGTVRQYSADVAATWLVRPLLQLDAGANIGLNRATPDVQLYLGASTRF